MFRQYIYNRDFILFFWLPRIITSIIFLFLYKNIHLTTDTLDPSTVNFDYIPDGEKYLNTFKWNPLFSYFLQLLNNIFANTAFIQVLLAQIISGLSCITIFIYSRKILNINKLALLMMAVHPMLVLYGNKFCTENFGLVAIAIFLVTRVNIKNYKIITRIKLLKIQSQSIILQFISTLFRAQNVVFLTYEIYCLFKDFFLKKILNIFKNKSNFVLSIVFFIALISLSLILINSFSTYIRVMSPYLWDKPYLLSAKKLFYMIFSEGSNLSFIQKIFGILISYILYFLLAIIFLTGARERLISEPWAISIGNFNFNYDMGNSVSNFNTMNFEENAFFIDFFLKIIIPLILFSTFHLIGLFQWQKHTKNFGFGIRFYTLFIGLAPLILHPMMRYFIPLIPISCIGFSLYLNKAKFIKE